mgnify:CR=1 FL=1
MLSQEDRNGIVAAQRAWLEMKFQHAEAIGGMLLVKPKPVYFCCLDHFEAEQSLDWIVLTLGDALPNDRDFCLIAKEGDKLILMMRTD